MDLYIPLFIFIPNPQYAWIALTGHLWDLAPVVKGVSKITNYFFDESKTRISNSAQIIMKSREILVQNSDLIWKYDKKTRFQIHRAEIFFFCTPTDREHFFKCTVEISIVVSLQYKPWLGWEPGSSAPYGRNPPVAVPALCHNKMWWWESLLPKYRHK